MMIYHFIWMLLPLVLLWLLLRALYRSFVLKLQAEHVGELSSETTFSTLVLIISIVLDSYIFVDLTDGISWGPFNLALANWLIYPALMMIAAGIASKVFEKKELTSLEQLRQQIKKSEY